MADKGSFETTKYGGKRSIEFSWSLLSQSIENNTSTISWSLTGAGSNNNTWYNTRNGYLNINKGRVWTQKSDVHLFYGTVLSKGTYIIAHSSDGTASFSADCGAGIFEYGKYQRGSGSWSLPTIPRKTVCPNISGYIEEGAIISLNPASNNFKHRLYYSYNGKTGYYPSSTGFFGSTGSLSLDNDFYNYTPKTEGYGNITLYTYSSDGAEIGSTSGSLTVRCSEQRCIPSVSIGVIDVNPTTVNITKDEHVFIKGYSNAKVTWTATPKNAASINYSTIDGVRVSSPTNIPNIPKKYFDFRTFDSRGYSKYESISLSMIDYFGINLDFKPHRTLPTKDKVTCSITGSFYNNQFGNTGLHNSLNLKWKYRVKGDTAWIEGNIIQPTVTGNEFKVTDLVLSETAFDHNKNYEIAIMYSDALTQGSEIAYVTKGKPVFNWENELFNVNGTLTVNEKNIIDIVWPKGSVYITMGNENPKDLFGGTWELLPHDRYLLCTQQTPGHVGGNASHSHTTGDCTLTIDNMPTHSHGAGYSGANFQIRHGNTAGTATVAAGANTSVDTGVGYLWGNGLATQAYQHNIDRVNIGGTVSVYNTGNGLPHNHGNTGSTTMWQPYICIRAWKRVG